jgi:hypothetical protein
MAIFSQSQLEAIAAALAHALRQPKLVAVSASQQPGGTDPQPHAGDPAA